MRRSRACGHLLALSACIGLVMSCTDFDRVDRNLCGNAIVEPLRLEDCDGAPVTEAGVSYVCGAQSAPEACRLLCNTQGRACPDGWSCSLHDGICRQSRQGQFALAEILNVPQLTRVTTADVDADRLADLIVGADDRNEGTTQLTTYHFDAAGAIDGEPLREAEPLLRNAPIVVGRLGTAGTSDEPTVTMLFAPPRAPGVSTLRGRRDRTWAPTVIGMFTGLGEDIVLAPLAQEPVGSGLGYQLAFGSETSVVLSAGLVDPVANQGMAGPLMIRVVPDLPDALPTRHIAKGEVASVTFPGVELLVAVVPGESHARLYAPQPGGEINWPYDEIALPERVLIPPDGGAWLGDINGDSYVDLLVAGDDGHTYLAYGFGFMGFKSSLVLDVADNRTGAEPVIRNAHPLGVAHIDDDAFVDFVFARDHAIALSNPALAVSFGTLISCPELSTEFVASYTCATHTGSPLEPPPEWHSVMFTDVNGDGRDDVIAAAANANELDVLIVADSPRNSLIRHRIETPGRVRSLTVADVDGDLISDVVFHTEGPDHARVFTVLGQQEHGPEAPQLLLEAPFVAGVVSDGIRVFVAWRTEETGPLQVTYTGGTTRLLTGSFIPCPTQPGEQVIEQQLVMGRFDDREGLDVALLYRDCYRPRGASEVDQLVLYPAGPLSTLEAVFDTPWIISACPDSLFGADLFACEQLFSAWHPTSVEIEATPDWSTEALLAPLQLDPADGAERDALIAIAPTGDTTSELRVFGLDPEPPGLPRFALLQTASLAVRIGGSYEDGWRGKLQTVDVDADGDLDIVALTSGPTPTLVVIHNDAGRLRKASPLLLPSAPEGRLRSFSIYDADYDLVADDMVLATDGQIYVLIDAFSGAATATRITVESVVDSGNDSIIDQLLTADFNGDGLTDVAAVFPTSVRVLRSLPANP